VPSAVPQPKLNFGVPLLAGLTWSLMVTAGTFPPFAQASTAHRACWPRALLCCAAVTSTQRLAGSAVVDGEPVGAGVVVVAVAVGVAVAVAVVVGGSVVVGASVGVAVGGSVDVAVVVGEAAGEAAELDAEDAGLAVVGAGVVGCGVAVVDVGVAGAVVGAVVSGEDVAVGVTDGLGDAAGSSSDWQDCLLAGGAASVAAAARLAPETAVSRTLPVTRATAAGRGCANRMRKRLPLLLATARNGSLDYRQSYPIDLDDHSFEA
jgi:hypothetical protein